METYVAVFDVGTTAIKGILVNDQGGIAGERSVSLRTYHGHNGEIEQNPFDWWDGVKTIASHWWSDLLINPDHVTAITFSGQMEDVIPIAWPNTCETAILYSDTRAEHEASYVNDRVPFIDEITGNPARPSTPLAKLLWLKKYVPQQYEETQRFVFNAKDFIIYQLTHALVTDPTTAATTGMMNLRWRQWATDVLEACRINQDRLPTIHNAEKIVGYVAEEAAEASGFAHATPVLCGSGDAGASALGAAATNSGDTYVYIGTTGWAAAVQGDIDLNQTIQGLFNLAHLPQSAIIRIAPLLNAGNVHQWAAETFVNSQHDNLFAAFENLINQSEPGSGGLLFLPYLNGERCPVEDKQAKGAFWGIGPDTAKSDMARAVMEGICFSCKQIIDLIRGEDTGTLTLIGGGSKSNAWCQILADVTGETIRVPVENDYMTAFGVAASAFIQLGWAHDYQDFSARFLETAEATLYEPITANVNVYKQRYEQYLKMYPNLKGLYN